MEQSCKDSHDLLNQRCPNKTYRSTVHSQSLLGGLVSLRDSKILFDVVLRLEGRHLEAHRILLAASCDYFRGMFAGGLREMDQQEVDIHGISYASMCNILNFIYTSELELSLTNVQETLAAACQLQIPEVITFCCDFLISWVDEENILELYRLADLFDLSPFSNQLDTYILKNFSSFSKSQSYRQLPLEKVYSLLSSNRLEVESENEVYEAALLYHYTQEQVETDQVSLIEPSRLLEAVRFPLMEVQLLQRLHDKLSQCPLKEMVANALSYHKNECLQPVLQGPQTELRSEYHCLVGFGGMYAASSVVLSDQAKFLHPLFGGWRQLIASQAPKMSNQGIAVLNNFAYLIGGDNNVRGYRAEARCWRYDPRHNKWFQIQSMQQEHADLSVCAVGEYLYAVGGRDYREELKVVERYDPRTNTWTYVAPLEKEVYAHAGAALDGKVYISCGKRGDDYLKETHCYDPESDKWEQLEDSPVRRAWHGMVAVHGRLYVIGGSNNVAAFRKDVYEVDCYSPQTRQWTMMPSMPAGHGEPGIAVLGNKIYVLGGRSHDSRDRMDYVDVFDFEKEFWDDGPHLEDGISGMAACVLTLPRSVIMSQVPWTPTPHRDWMLDNSDFATRLVSGWEDLDILSED